MGTVSGLTVLVQGHELHLEAGNRQNLLQAVYLSGMVEPPPLCAGLGRCGRCKMLFLSPPPPVQEKEKDILGAAPAKQGWRLGCLHRPLPGMRVQLPDEVRLLEQHSQPAGTDASASSSQHRLAVDFGSTSLHYAITGPQNAPRQAKISVNPQMGAGPDVISRIGYALNGGQSELAALSRAALDRMVNESDTPVSEICIAANPAMTLLLLDKNPQGLAAAPYSLDYRGGQTEHLPGLPPVWAAPLIAPFIGGDISAGYAGLALCPEKSAEYPFILADMGTNGEFVLALDKHTALAASLPLGPALEGIGMHCGTEARSGVVTGFSLSASGLAANVLGGHQSSTPSGISGTGYLSLLGQLSQNGLLQKDGRFYMGQEWATPLARKLSGNFGTLASGEVFWSVLPDSSLILTATDVEEILKIKAAFTLALKLLLKEAGLGFGDIKTLYLAGSLGSHIRLADLEQLGFIPPGASVKTIAAGNTSLAGALLLVQHPELRPVITEWAAGVKTLAITDMADFQEKFTTEMQFEF